MAVNIVSPTEQFLPIQNPSTTPLKGAAIYARVSTNNGQQCGCYPPRYSLSLFGLLVLAKQPRTYEINHGLQVLFVNLST